MCGKRRLNVIRVGCVHPRDRVGVRFAMRSVRAACKQAVSVLELLAATLLSVFLFFAGGSVCWGQLPNPALCPQPWGIRSPPRCPPTFQPFWCIFSVSGARGGWYSWPGLAAWVGSLRSCKRAVRPTPTKSSGESWESSVLPSPNISSLVCSRPHAHTRISCAAVEAGKCLAAGPRACVRP